MRTYKVLRFPLKPNQILVFGSNTQGRHGKGSALLAVQKCGAIYGQAEGLQGQSWAIITKDLTKRVHPSRTDAQIREQIEKLYAFARVHTDKEFVVVYRADNQNLNGYSSEELASFFRGDIPENIIFEEGFSELVRANTKYSLFD